MVAIIAPQTSSLLGLVSTIAPALAAGNVVVAVASQDRPLPAITLAEVLGTSDVPGGVVNLLTGSTAELAPVLASHMDVNAIDLTGAPPDAVADLEIAAAGSTKRIIARPCDDAHPWHDVPGIGRMQRCMEIKTVWHPMGI